MNTIQSAPQWFQYDIDGIFYFEVYPDGRVISVSGKIGDVTAKKTDSVYGSYFRVANGECTLYLAALISEGHSTVYHVDDMESLADSFGIVRESGHVHEIHAALSQRDAGSGRYADLDIEFRCGCVICRSNRRIMREQLRQRFGWEIILNSIGSEPLSKRTITVERKSLSKTPLPF